MLLGDAEDDPILIIRRLLWSFIGAELPSPCHENDRAVYLPNHLAVFRFLQARRRHLLLNARGNGGEILPPTVNLKRILRSPNDVGGRPNRLMSGGEEGIAVLIHLPKRIEDRSDAKQNPKPPKPTRLLHLNRIMDEEVVSSECPAGYPGLYESLWVQGSLTHDALFTYNFTHDQLGFCVSYLVFIQTSLVYLFPRWFHKKPAWFLYFQAGSCKTSLFFMQMMPFEAIIGFMRRVSRDSIELSRQLQSSATASSLEPEWPAGAPTPLELNTSATAISNTKGAVGKAELELRLARVEHEKAMEIGSEQMRRVDLVTSALYGKSGSKKIAYGLRPIDGTRNSTAPPPRVLELTLSDGPVTGSLAAHWKKVTSATYEVQWFADEGMSRPLGAAVAAKNQTFIPAAPGVQIWLRVRAIRGKRFGEWSETATRISNV